MLYWLLATALAARGPHYLIVYVEAENSPVTVSTVTVTQEGEPHRVDDLGRWSATHLYPDDGSEVPLIPRMVLDLEVGGPGYQTAQLRVVTKRRRRTKVHVTLNPLVMQPIPDTVLPEPAFRTDAPVP